MRVRRTIGAALLMLATAAGCSSAADPTVADGAGVDAGEIGVETSSAPALSEQQLGKPFRYQETFSDGTAPVDWEVTVTGVRCGLTVLKNAADNPAYTSGDWSSDDVPPEQIDAEPAPGKAFCRMDATMTNVGRTPAGGTENFGDLETDRGRFAAGYEEDMTLSANLLEMEKAPGGPFNPGDAARVIKVWSVPTGAEPVAVLFPGDTAYDKSAYRIAVT
jgi:hypothetical protein